MALDKLKIGFSKKDQVKERKGALKAPGTMKLILLICDEEQNGLKAKIENTFSAAKVHHLFKRPIKEDRTVGFFYSVHSSDIGITGKVKNDKLSNLLKMPFDLVFDLTNNDQLLNALISKLSHGLIVGKINSENEKFHDLMFEFNGDFDAYIKKVFTQLNKLTNHES